jgi:hypothetical protein
MNSSSSFLEKEINYLFKFAQIEFAGLAENLEKIYEIFKALEDGNLLISTSQLQNEKPKLDSFFNEKIKSLPGININQEDIDNNFNKIKDKLEKILEAKRIAEAAYNILLNNNDYCKINNNDKILKSEYNNWIFNVFRDIRNLLLEDIEIIGKKEVESYFPNYKKILYILKEPASRAQDLGRIVQFAQEGMLSCFYREKYDKQTDIKPILEDIITKPQLNLSLRQSAGSNLLIRDLDSRPLPDSPVGNLLISGATHTISAGGSVQAKVLRKYVAGRITSKIREDKIGHLSKLLVKLEISPIINEGDLEKKFLKIKFYTELTGDNEIYLAFSALLNNINSTKVSNIEDEVKELPSFIRLKEKKNKLNTILRLVFDQKTIENLSKYCIVQEDKNSPAKLMPKNNKSSGILDLSPEEFDKIAQLAKSAADLHNDYLFLALSQEINNLLFKIN